MGFATSTTSSTIVSTLYLTSLPSSMGCTTSTTCNSLVATLYLTSQPSSKGFATSTTLSKLVATIYLTTLSSTVFRSSRRQARKWVTAEIVRSLRLEVMEFESHLQKPIEETKRLLHLLRPIYFEDDLVKDIFHN